MLRLHSLSVKKIKGYVRFSMHHLSILSYAVKRRVGLRRLRSLQRESWPLTASMMIKHLLVRSYEVSLCLTFAF
ncbi:hypothetical protein ACJBU6_09208 [Exserohilum turcicum]